MFAQDTPDSSPPPENDGVSEAMLREENEMAEKRREEQIRRDKEMEQQRKKDLKGGKGQTDSKFKALEYLLNQSKVCGQMFVIIIVLETLYNLENSTISS